MPVVHGISQKPLAFDRVTLDVTNGVMFAQALEAKDGTPPYVWQALDPLPRGLALSSTGVISGLSKARPGDYVVRVRVTDAFEDSVETPVTIKITAQPLVFQPPTIKLKLMERMSYALRAQGGTPDYRWSALGALPDGLTLSDDGILSGTPTKAGDYQVPIRVTDDAGMTDTQNVSISVTVDPLEFKAPSLDLELSRHGDVPLHPQHVGDQAIAIPAASIQIDQFLGLLFLLADELTDLRDGVGQRFSE